MRPKGEEDVVVESFNSTFITWSSLNDLVMGGDSTDAVGIKDEFGTERIKTVVDAPFLHFPGFVRMVRSGPFPDVSTCANA